MKLYDNDAYRDEFMEAVYNLLSDDSSNDRANQVIDLFDAAPAVEAEPAPSNTPLTLEQLREMDGEPVWVVELNGYPPHWGLVYWYRKNKRNIVYVTISNGASICAEAFMAAGGKIYRRKPEEGTP